MNWTILAYIKITLVIYGLGTLAQAILAAVEDQMDKRIGNIVTMFFCAAMFAWAIVAYRSIP